MTLAHRVARLLPWAVAVLAAAAPAAHAAELYVGPKGTPQGKGTRESPWDIESALLGKPAVRPGDTVYLLGGTYRRRPKENFEARLAGTEGKPVHVRPAPGERAIIDGGLLLQEPAAHLWVWDVEILVSEPQPEKPVGPGSHPEGFTRPWGGVHTQNDPAHGGRHCKLINLVVHDCRQGMSLWAGTRDLEVYGCLIYDNGWKAVDRGHGHGIYTQNREGRKTVADCIFTGGPDGTYGLHAYGSEKAFVDDYLVEGNILYDGGPLLIGGDRPSHDIRVRDNSLYNASLRLGRGAPSEDCEVRGNVVVNGDLTITKFKQVDERDNLVVGWKAPRPAGARVVLRPNKYDPRRANLAVYNWEKKPTVPVDPGRFLKAGDRYRLMNPKDFFGKPVLAGAYDGESIAVPVAGEFGAFVLLKESK